jgi:ABC-type transport system involved in cytochrome bd biosynthesis fused ATPase/permease subunit
MVKRTTTGRYVGTGILVSGGTLALGAWSPLAGVLLIGVVLLLALTAAVVVLTAARGRDRRRQQNSAAVLDRLLCAICRKGRSDP